MVVSKLITSMQLQKVQGRIGFSMEKTFQTTSLLAQLFPHKKYSLHLHLYLIIYEVLELCTIINKMNV